MNRFRRVLFRTIEADSSRDYLSMGYDIAMIATILTSLIPLLFRYTTPTFDLIEKVTVSIFIVDYLARWLTEDLRSPHKRARLAFLTYPFTFNAIIDLLSILPAINLLSNSFKVLRMSRLIRIVRLFKLFRYSNPILTLTRVLAKERKLLSAVLFLALMYIFTTALVMFNAEGTAHNPQFETFFDALYWATITLTTVGYGDIYPVSLEGRVISMISAIFGVALIALPSGIISASYMDEIRSRNNRNNRHRPPSRKPHNTSLSAPEEQRREERKRVRKTAHKPPHSTSTPEKEEKTTNFASDIKKSY